MSNYNLKIALTKLRGARVMDIEGKTCTKRCIVIPIDNYEGTVQDSYEGKIDGIATWKPLDEVYLNLAAFEFKDKKYGQTHGLKASFGKKRMAELSEDELRSMPFVGNIKPWGAVEDLPAGNDDKDW